jgi:hypothetical protein
MLSITRKVQIECEQCKNTSISYTNIRAYTTGLFYCGKCKKSTFSIVSPVPLTIAIDFDGTCVTHAFPYIGEQIVKTEVLQCLAHHNKLILYTVRSDVKEPKGDDPNIVYKGGNYLTDAVNWFKTRGIELYGVNENPMQSAWTHSPKVYADLYIDDAACGMPLDFMQHSRPCVDWNILTYGLEKAGLI